MKRRGAIARVREDDDELDNDDRETRGKKTHRDGTPCSAVATAVSGMAAATGRVAGAAADLRSRHLAPRGREVEAGPSVDRPLHLVPLGPLCDLSAKAKEACQSTGVARRGRWCIGVAADGAHDRGKGAGGRRLSQPAPRCPEVQSGSDGESAAPLQSSGAASVVFAPSRRRNRPGEQCINVPAVSTRQWFDTPAILRATC